MWQIFKKKPRGLWLHAWFLTRVLRTLQRGSVKLRIFNVKVIGRENVPLKGAVIVASNHISLADAVYLWGALRRNAIAIAMQELWSVPVLGQFIWLMGHIPVDRKDPDSGLRAIQRGLRALNAGALVIIYPEGRISRDGKLHRFKAGVYELAIASGAPVIPIGVVGTELVKPHGSWKINRRQPVEQHFGEALYAKNFTGTNAKAEFLDELRRRVAQLSGQELSEI